MNAREMEPAPERILVRCPNWLGDVVMATAGLRALREHFPGAQLIGQLPAQLAPLLESSDFFDEIWPIAPRGAGWSILRDEARRIAAARFDLGIVIPESISSALRMRWGRVGHIVGFSRDPIRRRLLHEIAPAEPAWGRRRLVSRERFVMTLMRAVGVQSDDLGLALSVSRAEQERLDSVLVDHDLDVALLRADPPVVLAPGAGFGPAKRWPAEFYAEIADQIAQSGRRVILVGGPGEGTLLASVANSMVAAPIVLDAALDLGSLKALISLARLLVANDSGTRHVAAAFRVPSVIFFGPTSLAKTSEHLEVTEVMQTEHACRPCYLRHCPIDHRCMRSIHVDDAQAAVQRVLRLPLGRDSDSRAPVAAR